MALELGKLVVEIDATTKELRDGLREANQRLDKFERDANKSTTSVSRSFLNLAGGIGAATAGLAALTTAAAGWVALRFGRAAIEQSAAIESLGVRLEVLTGTTEGAAQAMADIKALVTETPYGMEELGNAASSVAVIFGENTEAVSEFTAIAADLAAAFGRPVEQIGENLTRAFSSGLGAADVFREAGISAEIMKITGATDVAKISSTQLAEALRQMTEEGGKAFEAAAKRARTLEGAISNTEIALQNMQAALGDALSPAVIAVGVDVIQPFFKDLEDLIRENEAAITDWALDAMPKVVDGFVWLAEALASVLKGIGAMGRAWKYLSAVGAGLQVVVVNIVGAFRIWFSILVEGIRVLKNTGKAVAALATGDLAAANRAVKESEEAWERVGKTTAASANDVAVAMELAVDSFREAGEAGPGVFDNIADSISTGAAWLDDFNDRLKETTDRAKETARAAREGGPVTTGGGPEGRADIGAALSEMDKRRGEGKKGKEDETWLKGLGTSLEGDIKSAVSEGFKSGEVDAKGLALTLGTNVSDALHEKTMQRFFDDLEAGFEGVVDLLSDTLGESLQSAFEGVDFGFMSGALGSAIGAAAGVGLSLLMGSIGGTKSRQTFADIQRASGITETQEVRGIIAGPQNIAIAQVGNAIADAFIEPTSLLREQLAVQQKMLSALSGGFGGGGSVVESEATAMLQGSPSLV